MQANYTMTYGNEIVAIFQQHLRRKRNQTDGKSILSISWVTPETCLWPTWEQLLRHISYRWKASSCHCTDMHNHLFVPLIIQSTDTRNLRLLLAVYRKISPWFHLLLAISLNLISLWHLMHQLCGLRFINNYLQPRKYWVAFLHFSVL